MIHHFHPPLPEDEKLYNQKEPTETTLEELTELRRMPTYTAPQKVLQVLMFLVFGVPKLVVAIPFSVVAGGMFMLVCAVWRAMGRPLWLRLILKRAWAAIARILLFILGFYRKTFEGTVDSDARFICPNHVCFFDGWHFFEYGPRILGKKELIQLPVMSDVCDVVDGIAVDREKSTGISKILVSNAENSKEPPILIFPEGASTSGDYMLRFHTGAFLSDLPVQPAAIRYTLWGTTRSLSHISFFHHSWWMMVVFLGVPGISVHIKFLEPVSLKTSGVNEDPRTLADLVSLKIANELGVRVISLSSNSIYKRNAQKKND